MSEHGGQADRASSVFPAPAWAAVDAAITDGAEPAFSFLERLVAAPSTVGHEQEAQELVAAELARPWRRLPTRDGATCSGGSTRAAHRRCC